ncbi:hypothetical protein Cob_v013084 [Colletotrichum orbiculare MAFF 240422]|uniref:Zn(2)-C6 fungal-type domain-containing protein n=1 Tax=Colletotrichum orbiculare (strain 104-T / ATCC 96160 / CBS 514.97 / LARS 414 / MAFF 240422) TaxID=1213857 RepID=A0A484F7L9_COLOR|nr:hypothetical protein Cob_v013084 [Colletotrichum orbiculare MAFF 240422]
MPTTSVNESPEVSERSRCWECLRRRLVCDSVKPICNKCRASGIVCPGYDDKKPLTWLAPGKVTCRTRRKGKGSAESAKPSLKRPPKGSRRALRPEDDIFQGVECIFHAPLRSDVCDVYDAVQYYNAVFFPHTSFGHRSSASNVFVDQIPLRVVRYLPTAIAHNLVAIVFQHRMCVQTQWKLDCPSAKHAEARLHHHRGISIRALNEEISNDKTQGSDVVLTGVILLLHSEIQSCISPHWRQHAHGLLAMLATRGGPGGWVKEVPQLKGMLLSFLICAVMANTTSPAHDPVRIAPHTEFMEINNIRDEMANGLLSKEIATSKSDEVLRRIETFDVTTWQGFYENEDYNEIIGLMFQSAVVVYCISSLQSISALPSSRRLAVVRQVHSDRLYLLLAQSNQHPAIQKSILWPLIVAGVEAGVRVDKRALVAELFMGQSKDVGTPLPSHAKGVLRTFWDGSDANWDACFDKPYAFVT